MNAQRAFFSGVTAELAPMSLSSLAEALGVHPSTVSRATKGKFLQCRQGTYPCGTFSAGQWASRAPRSRR